MAMAAALASPAPPNIHIPSPLSHHRPRLQFTPELSYSRLSHPEILFGRATEGARHRYYCHRRDAMGVDLFSGRGVGFGFGIGCGFGIGWGFGGAPLNTLGIGAGGGCGIGLGLGWGFGAAYGTKYLDSKLRFEGIDFDKMKGEHLDQKRLEESSTQHLE